MVKLKKKFSLTNLISAAFGVLLVSYFFLPLLAMGRFAFQTTPVINLTPENILENWNFESAFRALADEKVQASAGLTGLLTLLTILITFVALVPIASYVEIRKPKWKPYLTALTILPWVVPPVALVVGVAATFRPIAPWFISNPLSLSFFYAIWMLPFSYRAIEGQLRLIGIKTLYEAAQSLGSGWRDFFLKIAIPNLRNSLLISSLLIIAAVTGEFTFAALLLKQTFPVYLIDLQSEDVRAGYALALIVILTTAALLSFITLSLRRKGQSFNAVGV